MELKIVDPNAPDMAKEFGISEDRLRELIIGLRKIVEEIIYCEIPVTVRKSAELCKVAALCNTTEELALCIHMHDGYMFQNFEQVETDGNENA